MKIKVPKFALLLLVCICGCTTERHSASQKSTANHAAFETTTIRFEAKPADQFAPDIEPGFYRDGAIFDRVSSVVTGSDASILLDPHSGIVWYDKASKKRFSLDSINEVKPLMASIESKRLVTVSTGKATWDKYDHYVEKVAEFADELGFDMTIVTDDNARGLLISKVIQHRN